jgi:hypothetical protein
MAYSQNNPLIVSIDGTTAGVSATLVRSLKVIDAIAYVTTASGGAASTCKIGNASSDISDAFSVGTNVDKTVGRAGTIDSAQATVAAGGSLKATTAGGATIARAMITCVAG